MNARRTLLPALLLLCCSSAAIAEEASAPVVHLPFACGRAFVVSQAHDIGSHLHYDRDAWDFRMPDGVPIVAALDGVVRLARGDSTTGGCDAKRAKEANFVVVAHEGGLETQYLHFSRVTVSPGERVRAGDLLGYSGRTGWACGSHLHFKVARAVGEGWNNPSVPARIAGYGDPQEGAVLDSGPCVGRPFLASLDLGLSPDAGAPGAAPLAPASSSAEGGSARVGKARSPAPADR